MEFYVFFVLFAYSLRGLLAGPPVEVTPEKIILLENRPLEVRCRVRQPIAYCRFAVPGVTDGLSLRPGIPPHQGIQYLGAGLEQGECGMLIQNVSSKHSGVISCSMGFNSEPTESKGNLTLIVARPPDPPNLQVYPGSTYRDAFREGESIQANCRIVNARPVANISWYLGAEPIYDRLGPTVIEEENGFMSISQNMTRKVTYLDHGKDLKCVAGHIALGQGNINHSIYKLNIRFPPKPKSQELEKFGFTIGQPGKIVVTFQANPIPDIVWKVDQDNLKQGTRDRTGRFEAGILQHRGAGTWDAILLINTVRPEEVEKRYTLIAQNELGHESYKVAISTSPEPPADITAGTIVGIVIAVLVILLLVFILIFARATGRWCFAAGTNGKKSSSEVAIEDGTDEKRPPSIQGKDGVYSSTEYINGGIPRPPGESHPSWRWFVGKRAQRNPKKVNSLTYENFTLVERADGTKSYVSPEEKARLLLEGKLDTPKMSVKNEKTRNSVRGSESESDSGYEIPMEKQKPKSCNDLDKIQQPEMKRNGSFPVPRGMSPGENGRIKLPPYLVPLETSLTLPMSKEKRKCKKNKKIKETDRGRESSSLDEVDYKKRFSLRDPFWATGERKSGDAYESPEDAEVRRITEDKELKSFSLPGHAYESEETEGSAKLRTSSRVDRERESKKIGEVISDREPEDDETLESVRPEFLEVPPENNAREKEGKGSFSRGLFLPKILNEPPKTKQKRSTKLLDPNPLKSMFGKRAERKEEGEGQSHSLWEDPRHQESPENLRRYDDADLSEIRSDTESADHGSTDKSSVSKLTSEKHPKKLMSGLLGSFRKGRSKDKVADNDPTRNPSSFEITIKEQLDDVDRGEVMRTEGIVYAELDMARSPGSVMRRDDEKTEYAEIIYPGSKPTVERAAEELQKSRENLSSSRENLTEVDEAFSTSPDGKKEAAV